MSVYSVILAGGSGTRFWPLSRRARPKQFLPLASSSPLLVDTARRAFASSSPGHTLVSCGEAHAAAVRRLLKSIPASNILIEPLARNTAPAIGLAATHVSARSPEAVMQVLPADHAILDQRRFTASLTRAARLAERGLLVTLGIRPSRPETGYGYIELGEGMEDEAFRVKSFVEKPDLGTAERYLESGQFLWNAGIFIFRADAILEAIAAHLPDLSAALERISSQIGKPGYRRAVAREFKRLPSLSIDYGVMEKAANLAVVRGDFGWSDLGSFASLADVRRADERGNVVSGEVGAMVDCDNCVIFAGKRPLALAGLSQMVVIDAGDVVLVASKRDSQKVRQLVQAFEERGLRRYL